MRNRNPAQPWNPADSVDVSPVDYERQVLAWLSEAAGELPRAQARHLVNLEGTGGGYEFDVVLTFTGLAGAEFIVVVECKRHRRPVEREAVLSLHAKMRDVGAHKAMLVSTSGFQYGALEYAAAHGIATVTFIDGRWTYETKSTVPVLDIPPWVEVPRFAGHFLRAEERRLHGHLVEEGEVQALRDWLELPLAEP